MSNKERINATLGALALYACTGAFTCEQDDVALFIKHFLQLEDQSESAEAWNARYNELLERVESSRPQEVAGSGNELPVESVVVDKDGSPWWRVSGGTWRVCGGSVCTDTELPERWGPYTIIYTPTKEES